VSCTCILVTIDTVIVVLKIACSWTAFAMSGFVITGIVSTKTTFWVLFANNRVNTQPSGSRILQYIVSDPHSTGDMGWIWVGKRSVTVSGGLIKFGT